MQKIKFFFFNICIIHLKGYSNVKFKNNSSYVQRKNFLLCMNNHVGSFILNPRFDLPEHKF